MRLESKTLFNGGVFLADVAHMPTGCGTWPAWWTYGPNWPTNGEIGTACVCESDESVAS